MVSVNQRTDSGCDMSNLVDKVLKRSEEHPEERELFQTDRSLPCVFQSDNVRRQVPINGPNKSNKVTESADNNIARMAAMSYQASIEVSTILSETQRKLSSNSLHLTTASIERSLLGGNDPPAHSHRCPKEHAAVTSTREETHKQQGHESRQRISAE